MLSKCSHHASAQSEEKEKGKILAQATLAQDDGPGCRLSRHHNVSGCACICLCGAHCAVKRESGGVANSARVFFSLLLALLLVFSSALQITSCGQNLTKAT
jgi:hypothetical protein